MAKVQSRIVQKRLVSWILFKNKKLQILLVVTAAASVFANILPLEMQKRIVNDAINLGKFNLLAIYCGIYLAAFAAASGLKFLNNSLQTVIGQRTISDMRKELYAHILTLPFSFHRRTQPGLVVAAMTTELATAGDFVGMAVAVPATNLLMLFAFAGYLFHLNPLLAAATLSIYPIVLLLVPALQKRVNSYNKKRVDAGRRLSGRIGESVAGIHEIQANGAFLIETNKFDKCVDQLRRIRIIWKLFRYAVKAVNSLFTNLSRFLVFALGGYLAIKGQLELGALVAFLSAQEKLYDPWKELIEFYQAYQTSSVTYNRTMEYFEAEAEHELIPDGRKPYDLDNDITVENLSFVAEDGTRLLSEINFRLKPGEHMALVGFSGSGKSTLAHCLVQLCKYSSGRISIGRQNVATLSRRDIICNVGFVSQTPFIFEGTIEDNLLYAHLAQSTGKREKNGPEFPSLDRRIEILQQCGFFTDVLRFGLNMTLNRNEHQELKSRIIMLRTKFLREFSDGLSDYIEYYDRDRYLRYASIAENLMFGVPLREPLNEKNLHANEFFLNFLEAAGLKPPLVELGADLVVQTVETFGDLAPSAVLAASCPIGPQEMEDCKILAKRLKNGAIAGLGEDDRRLLLKLALRYNPGQHRLIDLPRHHEQRVLAARSRFRKMIAAKDPESVSFFERSRYIDPLPILSNIFFGNITTDSSRGQEKINQSINRLLIEDEILETVLAMGMQHQVGRSGENLSGGQRQKLAIARTLLKQPKVLVLDEATSGLDNASQARIQNLLETQWKDKSTLIAVVHRLDIIGDYDRIAVMEAGRIVEMGTYDELMDRNGILRDLVHGKK